MGLVESSRRCKPGYERVIVSEQETWSSTAFLDYYLRTRKYAVTPSNRALLRVVFRRYRGPRPIKVAPQGQPPIPLWLCSTGRTC